ncbi:hypothetical protein KUV85_13420 [Nocardioides panacisoli]|uniref:hypothetical protein n=1 Tax=Nocardioides panacisoli TaxID=627624 RepID=UPI001C63B769|nr:hypothetical protein [Nocardioides panacisoli]QYJ03322.1 hypothetical protein KUV85_13420 [Nocardioides panacisoli]
MSVEEGVLVLLRLAGFQLSCHSEKVGPFEVVVLVAEHGRLLLNARDVLGTPLGVLGVGPDLEGGTALGSDVVALDTVVEMCET